MFANIAHPQKRAFLAAYSECGLVSESAEIAGISRETHYHWRRTDPEYADAFALAIELAADLLEDTARRRANGHHSDKVLLFLLTHLKPKVFGKKIEHAGEVKVKHSVDYSQFSTEELEQLVNFARRTTRPATEPGSARSGTPSETPQQAGDDVPGDGSIQARALPEAP